MSFNKELFVFKRYFIVRNKNGLLCFLASLKTTAYHSVILKFFSKRSPIWERKIQNLSSATQSENIKQVVQVTAQK